MKILMMALVVGLLVSGCASLPDTVKALAKDNASVCIVIDAALYGKVLICRSNTDGAAMLRATTDALEIQHRGTAR